MGTRMSGPLTDLGLGDPGQKQTELNLQVTPEKSREGLSFSLPLLFFASS